MPYIAIRRVVLERQCPASGAGADSRVSAARRHYCAAIM